MISEKLSKIPHLREGETREEELKEIDGNLSLRICYFMGEVCTYDTGYMATETSKATYIASLQTQIDVLTAKIAEIEGLS